MSQRLDLTGVELGDGRYQVIGKLGEGSMGIVYRAYDKRLETEVVVKVPTAATLNDPEFAERFQRETRSLVKLTHPHVVTIHDVGSSNGAPYVVMQFLSGGSLRDRIVDDNGRCHPQPPESLKDWLPAMARALDFIHKQSFLHRDVKPANILFDSHGNAFLSDFGLAKALSNVEASAKRDASLTAAGFLVGTPNYVAPELIMGHAHDGKVDQYSLAMTAYEVLAGCVPVEGPSASATMVNQTSMKIPPISQFVPSVSDAISEVILRGLAKNQKKRFETCEEFADAVMHAIRGASQSATVQSGRLPVPSGRAPVQSGKMSRAISKGRIPCPECGKVLPLKPQFAGKRARCGKCFHLLQIGDDLMTLRVVGGPPAPKPVDDDDLPDAPQAPRTRKSARDTVKNRSGQTGRNRVQSDSELETILGEEAFGWYFGRQRAIWIALGLVLALAVATAMIGYAVSLQKEREAEKKLQTYRPTSSER